MYLMFLYRSLSLPFPFPLLKKEEGIWKKEKRRVKKTRENGDRRAVESTRGKWGHKTNMKKEKEERRDNKGREWWNGTKDREKQERRSGGIFCVKEIKREKPERKRKKRKKNLKRQRREISDWKKKKDNIVKKEEKKGKRKEEKKTKIGKNLLKFRVKFQSTDEAQTYIFCSPTTFKR
jgi:hypothetical protein